MYAEHEKMGKKAMLFIITDDTLMVLDKSFKEKAEKKENKTCLCLIW